MPVTDISQLDLNGSYTYADYLTWQFQERLELIKGKIFRMSPAPNTMHQKVSWKLSMELGNFFSNTPCQAFSAPFDVRLYKKAKDDKQITTVVQPDICVICDESKLDERGCLGSPDLIVEILSPGNSKKEMRNKYDLYEENGVKEYWVVFPHEQVLQIYVLKEGKYTALRPLVPGDPVTSLLWKDMAFDVGRIFPPA